MNVSSATTSVAGSQPLVPPKPNTPALDTFTGEKLPSLREAFDDFVGQTVFGQMIASMRKTVEKPAYFHGGRAEEVFQGQMDQLLAERISKSSADTFSGPMFDLMMARRP